MSVEPAAIARFGEYATLLFVAGALSFWIAVAPPSLRREAPQLFEATLARIRALSRWAAAVALLASLLRLIAEAQTVGGTAWPEAGILVQLLTETGFGTGLLLRVALVSAL
ncbi:MAG TPA: hypothetical protein VK433_08525, partial [Stellaceae bacterium]|nr:hypothetical protein [Stellaceae bacterium]